MQSTAAISTDGLFRYSLTRSWGDGPMATFVMCNPSTADASQDDPTIRRCIGFARSWGMSGLHVGNLYAFRATKPKKLAEAGWPVGRLNDDWLRAFAEEAIANDTPLVAAWGMNPEPNRIKAVLEMMPEAPWRCLGTTKQHGRPRHPLFVGKSVALEPYVPGR